MKKKLKIAYIIPARKKVGSINVVHDLVVTMQRNGHDCTLFYFDDKQTLDIPCTCKKISFFSSIPFNEFDVVHSHCFRPNLYIFLHRPLKKTNTIFLNTIHCYIFQEYRNSLGNIKGFLLALMDLLCMRRMDYNICLTNNAISYYGHFLKKKKLCVGYNTKIIDTNLSIPNDDLKILNDFKNKFNFSCCSICVISPIKGLEQIIMALPNLNAGFVVIGEGSEKERLLKIAREYHVEDKVLFMGYRGDAYKYLPLFDVYCMPSRSEGFPIALLEAAIYKKAVVCSNLPVFYEIFDETEVVYFQQDDISSCRNALYRANNDKYKYGESINKKFMACYSPDSFYSQHICIYSQNDKSL